MILHPKANDGHYRDSAETQEETSYSEASSSSARKNDDNEIRESENLKAGFDTSASEIEDRSYEECDTKNAGGKNNRFPDLQSTRTIQPFLRTFQKMICYHAIREILFEKSEDQNSSKLCDSTVSQQKWNPGGRFYVHPNHPNRINEPQVNSTDFNSYPDKSAPSVPKTKKEATPSTSSRNALDAVNQQRTLRPP